MANHLQTLAALRALMFCHDHGNGCESWDRVKEQARAAIEAADRAPTEQEPGQVDAETTTIKISAEITMNAYDFHCEALFIEQSILHFLEPYDKDARLSMQREPQQ